MIGAGFCGVEIRVADVLSQDPALTAQSYVVLEYTPARHPQPRKSTSG